MSSNSARVKVLYLEADNADAASVEALVGIVREVQSGRVSARVENMTVELQSSEPAPALPPAPKVRKPRAPKEAPQRVSKGPRAQGLTAAIVAAVNAAPQPDVNAVAKKVYGDSSAAHVTKVKRGLWSLCDRGVLKKIGDDTYKVVG